MSTAAKNAKHNKPKHDDLIVKYPILSKLLKTHIVPPVVIFFLYAAGLMYWAITTTDLSIGAIVGLYFGGLLFFTWVEYMVHKYFYHMEVESDRAKQLVYVAHGMHHDSPKDKNNLAMPPLLSLIIATSLLFIMNLIMDQYSFAFFSGFMTGYASYLIVHYTVHIYRPPNNFLKHLWINHAIHHYGDPNILFGVSTPLWDYIYGTLPKQKMKKEVEVKYRGQAI